MKPYMEQRITILLKQSMKQRMKQKKRTKSRNNMRPAPSGSKPQKLAEPPSPEITPSTTATKHKHKFN